MTSTVAARRRAARSSTDEQRQRRLSPRRAAFVVVVLMVGAATLAVVAFPTRTWWAQRQDLARTEANLLELRAENAALDARIKALQSDDAAVEQLARERYGMVMPGEQAFAILPPPPPDDLPAGWPYDTLRRLVTRP
jgi:cell division protein FtsB